MKNVRKDYPVRTLQHILLASFCLLIPISSMFASSNPEPEGERESLETSEVSSHEFSFAETELVLEDWMLFPFESKIAEPDLVLEDWMTSSFQ